MSSQAIPVPFDCNSTCGTPTGVTTTPGPQGAAGAAGAAGTNGIDAFTSCADYAPAAQPVMPAELASVTVNTTSNTGFLTVGEPVFVQFWGTLRVTAVPTSASVTLLNLEDTPNGNYPANAAPGTVLPALAKIVPSGFEGPGGSIPAGALLAANNLNDVVSVPNSRTNLGLGTAALNATGDFFQVANNLSEGVAATKRTNLGLGTMATQNANAVAITGGAYNGSIGATTPATGLFTSIQASANVQYSGSETNSGTQFFPPSAIQSLLAATAIAPNAVTIRVVGNGGAVVLVATPTITSPATDGQFLLIRGTSDVNTVTLQDEASLAGTKLALGAATRLLGAGDQILLAWDATSALWYEVSFTNN